MYEVDIPLGWDDDIPDHLRSSWIALIVEALMAAYMEFPRSTRPENAVGGPTVVGFGDGAFAAFAAAVYLVWKFSHCLWHIDIEVKIRDGHIVAESKVNAPETLG